MERRNELLGIVFFFSLETFFNLRKRWQHGTGHGFGAFLSVHEGPHSFSSTVPLVPGHVITNEPGFCKPLFISCSFWKCLCLCFFFFFLFFGFKI